MNPKSCPECQARLEYIKKLEQEIGLMLKVVPAHLECPKCGRVYDLDGKPFLKLKPY